MGYVPSARPAAPSALRRRNSISAGVPSKLDLPGKMQSSSFPPAGKEFPTVDLELLTFKPLSYTSLKDLIPYSPSAVLSPTGAASQTCQEISIRNRLVKQAAWAYLQPMASSSDAVGRHFCTRTWERVSGDFTNHVRACLGFINRHLIPSISRAVHRLLALFPFSRNGQR